MDSSFLSLKGKVALVTGGSRGIGRAVALQFADAGADVVITARKQPDLEKTAAEIRAAGRKCLAITAHSGKLEDVRNMAIRVSEEFGQLDILVNNAAANPVMESVLDMQEPPWDVIINVNIKGYFFLSQAAARIMKEHGGGCIINMSSVGGFKPSVGLGAYSVSKSAIIMMTKVMALELGQYNIRVNAIAPGYVQTDFSKALWTDRERLQNKMKQTPLGRMAQPEEIAKVALCLASGASSYITGQTIVVDGGMSL